MRNTALCIWLCGLALSGCLEVPDRNTDMTTGTIDGTTAGDDDGGVSGGLDASASTGGGPDGSSGGATTGGATGGTTAGGTTAGADAGKPNPKPDAGTPLPTGDAVPAGAHCAPVAMWDPKWVKFEEDVLVLTNQARAKGHNCDAKGNFGPAPALTMEPHLRCAARLHSQYMGDVANDFNHNQTATGLDPFERMTAAGYKFLAAGENIAVGQNSPQEVVNGWLDSDGHCANLMSKEFTQIGIGYDFGRWTNAGRTTDAPYWTQNFGRPR